MIKYQAQPGEKSVKEPKPLPVKRPKGKEWDVKYATRDMVADRPGPGYKTR